MTEEERLQKIEQRLEALEEIVAAVLADMTEDIGNTIAMQTEAFREKAKANRERYE